MNKDFGGDQVNDGYEKGTEDFLGCFTSLVNLDCLGFDMVTVKQIH